MLIEISDDQEERLLRWISEITSGEFEADVEPAGYVLEISIHPAFGYRAVAISGEQRLDLGDVLLTLGEDHESPAMFEPTGGDR